MSTEHTKRPSGDEFADLWNSSSSLEEAATRVKRTTAQASAYANYLRDKGHELKYMNQTRKPPTEHTAAELLEIQNFSAIRLKSISASLHGDIDEAGIPSGAYANTEGDTPVIAIEEPGQHSYLVGYVDDTVIDLVKKYLADSEGVSNPQKKAILTHIQS